MQIADAVLQFITYLATGRGCAQSTTTSYASDLKALSTFLVAEEHPLDVGSITPGVMRHYVSRLCASGYKQATIARRVYAVSSLFRYLMIGDN